MRVQPDSASRAISDYFNSPDWRIPPESDLLAGNLRGIMVNGETPPHKNPHCPVYVEL